MSHRDRQVPGSDTAGESEESIRETVSEPTQRRPLPEYDDDPFDIPPWSQSQPDATSSVSRSRDDRRRPAPAAPPAERGPARDPIPQLGDAFGQREPSRRPAGYEAEDGSPAAVRDPYDRLRRVANQPPQALSYDDAEFDPVELEPVAVAEPARRRFRGRHAAEAPRETAATPRPTARPRPSTTAQIGGLLAAGGVDQRVYLTSAAIGVLSLTFMAATVAGRTDALPDWLPIHFNAEGEPDRWGTPATLWRIPLLVVMLSAMSIVVAAFVGRRDRFAATFAVVSSLLVHVCAWIALLNLVW